MLSLLILLGLMTSGCTFSLVDLPGFAAITPTPGIARPPTPTPIPRAAVNFLVSVPDDTPAGDPITLNVLDEVTGLPLNPQPHTMETLGDGRYTLTLDLPAGTVLKYRYARQSQGTAVAEHTSGDRPVRYRLYWVNGPGEVVDVVSRWSDTDFEGPTGRIRGTVTDAESGQGIPNLLIAAGGYQTLSSADGSFLLERLPPGTHNVVAYALDGAYRTFQQGATVAANNTTPAPLRLERAPMVSVTFEVIVPADTIPGVPVRLAGNLYQLGNTFGDLSGGVSTLASRMPQLESLPDNRYTLTLSLPAGADLRYKYTLGDGLWNAEHRPGGEFVVRQMIVPESDHRAEDVVDTWRAGTSEPIWFEVTVPEGTPASDTISIQFNPYGWTEPIPMWPLGNNRWVYLLSSPLDMLGTIGYRYCRNGQCGSADDTLTAGLQSGGRPVSTSRLPQNIQDTVNAWAWMDTIEGPLTVPGDEVDLRPADFIAGVELQTGYHPSWTPRLPQTLNDVRGLQADWLILTPSWHYTSQNPPLLEPVPGQDPLWDDLITSLDRAGSAGLRTALRPVALAPGTIDAWWEAAPRDSRWWDVWFQRYRNFALHFAHLAEEQGVEILILGGGEDLAPALPGGTLPDGSPSNQPTDAEDRWRALLAEVRNQYDGTLAWAVPYPEGFENRPAFLDSVDMIYLLWSAPLQERTGPSTEAAWREEAARRLDTDVLIFQAQLEKPLVLSLAYPSVEGALTGCVRAERGGCLDLDALDGPAPEVPAASLDLTAQVDAYNAVLAEVNSRGWIEGVVTRGYFPPVSLRDKSLSVHGKPAADLLNYWYSSFRGVD